MRREYTPGEIRLNVQEGGSRILAAHRRGDPGPACYYPPSPTYPRGSVYRWTHVGPDRVYVAMTLHASNG